MFKPVTTEYPIPHHFSRHFLSMPRISPLPVELDDERIQVVSKSPILKGCLLSGLQALRPDVVGVLQGEYAVMPDGFLLLNRAGNWFSINTPLDNPLWSKIPFDKINTNDARSIRIGALEKWDEIPLHENTLIMSTIWSNYYHYTFDVVPKVRLAEQLGFTNVYIPHDLTKSRYQQSLLYSALGSTPLITSGIMRVRNPILAECVQSRDSLLWLREKMKFSAPPGKRRLLVNRSQPKPRVGDNIAQTPEFLELMARYGFETVDFGSGEKTIEEQVEMLSGAEIVLASHGAGLTNLAYLNPPLTVVEVFSAGVLSASFLQIAMHLGLRYYGMIEENVAANGNILVDVEELDRILRETLGRRKPAARRRKPAAEPLAA